MSEGTVLEERHRCRARKPHLCDWCGYRIKGNEEYVRSTIVGDGTIYTWHECDRCSDYVPKARDCFDIPDWEPMYTETFQEYMESEHPVTWWQWCVDDDKEWLTYAKHHRYPNESDRNDDIRRFTVALEHAQKKLEEAERIRKAVQDA